MRRGPIKLSGLIKTGKVVARAPAEGSELPDVGMVPEAEDARVPAPPVTQNIIAATDQDTVVDGRFYRRINVELIDPNPLAPREIYTTQMILERAEDLRSQGQHDPIHVIPNPDVHGRFIISDGWTRVRACLDHKVMDSLLAEIHYDLTIKEAAWFGYEQNEGRKNQSDLDRAFFYKKMIDGGESATVVAKRQKLSKTMLSFYMAYTRLPEEILLVARENPKKFSASVAYQLYRLHEMAGIRKAVTLASRYAEEEHTYRWLLGQVEAHLNPTKHKQLSATKQVRYANGYYKQKGDTFEVSITVSPEQQVSFAEAMEKLLDTVAVQAAKDPKDVQ
ncbi:ParB/RepB/Spo0J family partition protein [Sulfuricystis multivorans]|uniref:ParB/RepB/Spo0J family partition protein n=1 Tax=Sulfuricystis multivorans TaxID=2211108 RepID=UPI000F84E5E0|nr:ParB N-terminal domain-containing protein [Sulfuricystis multivorans]